MSRVSRTDAECVVATLNSASVTAGLVRNSSYYSLPMSWSRLATLIHHDIVLRPSSRPMPPRDAHALLWPSGRVRFPSRT